MSPADFSLTHRVIAIKPRSGECLGCGRDTVITHEALTFLGALQDGPGEALCSVCAAEAITPGG